MSGTKAVRPVVERKGLDPDPEEARRLSFKTLELILQDQERLSQQRVARRASSQQLQQAIDEPLPKRGRGPDDSLQFFFERVVPAMTRVNHPRFHAYIPAPGSLYGFLGEMLAAGTNPFTGSWLGAASHAQLELTVLRWIAQAVHYPADAAGVLTSGGSIANLVGLAAARSRFGREGIERGAIYVSDQGHHSVNKAALVLGFDRCGIRPIATDGHCRMELPALIGAIEEDRAAGRIPVAVCANAGTTNTGAIDPLPQIADLCQEQRLWLHVDAAYGGFAALTERGRRMLEGMERADSLTLDPHKWLYTPMGVGCALCRHRQELEAAFHSEGDYLQDVPRDEVNFFDRGPELSRPARAVSVWMLMRSVGIERLRDEIEADLELARLAEELLTEEPMFEVVQPLTLSIVVFRHRRRPQEDERSRAARDRALMEAVLEDGTTMLSTTELGNRTALRFVVQSHRTTEAEVRTSVRCIREIAAGLS